MAEDVLIEHPVAVGAGRIDELGLEGQRWLGIHADFPGGQSLVELDAQPPSLRRGVGPAAIDQFQHELLVVGRVTVLVDPPGGHRGGPLRGRIDRRPGGCGTLTVLSDRAAELGTRQRLGPAGNRHRNRQTQAQRHRRPLPDRRPTQNRGGRVTRNPPPTRRAPRFHAETSGPGGCRNSRNTSACLGGWPRRRCKPARKPTGIRDATEPPQTAPRDGFFQDSGRRLCFHDPVEHA